MSVKGCFTDFHIDFGGTSVWYHVFRGGKVGEPCLIFDFISLYFLWRGGLAFYYFYPFFFLFFGGEWSAVSLFHLVLLMDMEFAELGGPLHHYETNK